MKSRPHAWVEQARRARTLLPTERRRESTLAALTEIAAKCNSTRAALRNALAALDIAEAAGREDSALGERLLRLPVTLVEAFGRWQRLDPAAAARAVEQAALGKLSVRGFVSAEKSARPAGDLKQPFDAVLDELAQGTRYGRVHPHQALAFGMKRLSMPPIGFDVLKLDRKLDSYDRLCGLTARAVADTARLSQIAKLRGGGLSSLDHPEAELLRDGERWRHAKDDRIPVLGVIEVEAQTVLERYRLEAKARYLRAAAAASVYPAVIVLLPNAQARDATLDLWPCLPYDRLGIDPPAPDREHGASRPAILHLGRGQGAVVATSPATVWEDLCHDGAWLAEALAWDRPSR